MKYNKPLQEISLINILLLNNEIDMDDTIDEIDDLDRSSHSILSSFEEE